VNTDIFRAVLKGEPGARLDIVLLNAAAAIVAGGLAEDMAEGISIARETVNSGRAAEKLDALKAASNA